MAKHSNPRTRPSKTTTATSRDTAPLKSQCSHPTPSSLPTAWEVAVSILEQGGQLFCATLMSSWDSCASLSFKQQQSLIQQWTRQHLFSVSADGLMFIIDPKLSLRRLSKWSAFSIPQKLSAGQYPKNPKHGDHDTTLTAHAQMVWRLVHPLDDTQPTSTAPSNRPSKKTSTPKSSAKSMGLESIPFSADQNFPFLQNDVVLGVERYERDTTKSFPKGRKNNAPQSSHASNAAPTINFEPLYLVSRQQKTLTANLLVDRTIKISLVLGRKQWLIPIINTNDIPRSLLSKQGLVEVRILPDRGLIHEPEAEFINEVSDPDPESLTAILEQHLPHEFSEEVLQSCESLSMPVVGKSHENAINREDLRHLPLITIDGEDAKDFDDAVWAQKYDSGGFRLMVAIADVGHFVQEATLLDQAAFERGTSVYFPRRVVPMLPPALSENLCSLRPDVDRAVLVAEMHINAQGEITEDRFFPALIKSQARMTYNEVESLIFRESIPSHQRSPAVMENLSALKSVYMVLSKARAQRGALELDSREWLFRFDHGRVVDVFQAERLIAHRLIEECMIAANVCAAKFLAKHREPLLYRIHESPSLEKIALLHETMVSQGIPWHPSEPITPSSLSQVLELLRNERDQSMNDDVTQARYESLQLAVLRSLMQAQYAPGNVGHFGLGLTHYAHFTSPIRRYPDLLIHRGIMKVLTRQAQGIAHLTTNDTPPQDWGFLGLHCTQCEKRADEASRAAANQLRCELTLPMLGKRVEGLITGVAAFGLFVQLPISMADGLLPMRTLGNALGEYLEYSAEHQRIYAPRSRQSFGVGERINVVVQSVIPHQRKVDLSL